MVVTTRKNDVVWNYVGTLFSMASGFLLLPLLLVFLTDNELGLWYAFVAVGNLSLLFEFGFNPTFARNIVYCISGAQNLSKSGADAIVHKDEIDYHLLKSLLKTSKAVYATIALLAMVLVSTVGSFYIWTVTDGMAIRGTWIAWAIFCIAMFLNLYFFYTVTFLRGLGDIAGENKAKTFAKIAQLAVSAVLLFSGFGLVGAAVGYLSNGLLLRFFANHAFKKHDEINRGLTDDSTNVTRDEMISVFQSILYLAWRDGIVQLALYCSTQGTAILCSLFLGLAETGTYSVMFQFGQATYQLAGAYARSYYPAFQSSFAVNDINRQREIVSEGLAMHALSYIVITAIVSLVALPLLPFFKPGIRIDYLLYLGIATYLFLWNQHSICCNYIVSTNVLPYMLGYLIAALLGLALSGMFMGIFGMGSWGLVIGQAISQLVYNNWKWPRYILKQLGLTYVEALKTGMIRIAKMINMRLKKETGRV